MTQTPPSGPLGPVTTPPMSSASTATASESGCAEIDAASAAIKPTVARVNRTSLRIAPPPGSGRLAAVRSPTRETRSLTLSRPPLIRRLRQRALPVRRRSVDAVTMHARRRRRPRWALEKSRLAASARGQAVAQRMQADAEDRARRKRIDGHAIARHLARGTQLDGPHHGLAGRIAHDGFAGVIERREKYLQVIRIRADTRHDAREDVGLLLVVHRERVMRVRGA